MDMNEAETLALLDELLTAFNAKNVNKIVSHFSAEGAFLLAAGPEPHGTRFIGRDAIATALTGRFAAVPDIQWSDARSWVFGDKALTEWRVTGTLPSGVKLDCLGCDLWEFADGQVTKKDTYYKQMTG
jgi:ketosteroid isomerase-like protein